jgi:hypothetical protein
MWCSASSAHCHHRVYLDVATHVGATVLAPSSWHGVITVSCQAPSPTSAVTLLSSREIWRGRQQLGAAARSGHCHNEAIAALSRVVAGGSGPARYHQSTSAPRHAQRQRHTPHTSWDSIPGELGEPRGGSQGVSPPGSCGGPGARANGVQAYVASTRAHTSSSAHGRPEQYAIMQPTQLVGQMLVRPEAFSCFAGIRRSRGHRKCWEGRNNATAPTWRASWRWVRTTSGDSWNPV